MKTLLKDLCGTLILLMASSGLAGAQIQWQFETDGKIFGKPTVTESTIYVAAGKTLYAINREGKQLWQREMMLSDLILSVLKEGTQRSSRKKTTFVSILAMCTAQWATWKPHETIILTR